MLRIELEFRSDGTLARVHASGHAGDDPAGANIACAAATSLLRTAGSLLAAAGSAAGFADRPGEMAFNVAPPRDAPGGAGTAWLRGVSDFLLQGLRDLQTERPAAIALTVRGGPTHPPV
jgi:uncharacterized protein YsxB (DUF464 family)